MDSRWIAALCAALAVAGCTAKVELPRRVDLVAAPAGDVATIVKGALARAARERRDLLVYEGATWCEPCERFHRAAAAGALDRDFGTLRLIEFDADRDAERLAVAGYTSRLIPLFALPGPDGRASGRQIEGSIKGDGAVGEIAPRLRALVGPGAGAP